MGNEDIRELENMLLYVAQRMRQSDTYFKDLPIEHKIILNMAGKILGEVHSLLITYRYADDKERVRIANKINSMLNCVGD